jgi:molybdopterin converting factor small subunit
VRDEAHSPSTRPGAGDEGRQVRVTVEFYGVPRSRAGVGSTELNLPSPKATLGALLQALAARFPAWGRACLDDQGRLSPAYLANVDGQCFLPGNDAPLRDGDVILIFAADAGG